MPFVGVGGGDKNGKLQEGGGGLPHNFPLFKKPGHGITLGYDITSGAILSFAPGVTIISYTTDIKQTAMGSAPHQCTTLSKYSEGFPYSKPSK